MFSHVRCVKYVNILYVVSESFESLVKLKKLKYGEYDIESWVDC